MLLKIFDKLNTIFNVLRLKLLYGKKIKIGRHIVIRGRLYVRMAKNSRIIIGNNCFFNNGCSINSKELIAIGNNCLFGENVKIYDHDHIYNLKNTLIKDSGYKIKKVIIRDNCWICSNVLILRGSYISNNCVIGASSVCKNSIEDNHILYYNGKIKKIDYM